VIFELDEWHGSVAILQKHQVMVNDILDTAGFLWKVKEIVNPREQDGVFKAVAIDVSPDRSSTPGRCLKRHGNDENALDVNFSEVHGSTTNDYFSP